MVVLYRLPRAKEPVIAVLDMRKHPVPQASLERILGPLAHFQVIAEAEIDADSAVSEQVKRLEDIAKTIGYTPKVIVRDVETPVFVAGQFSSGAMAEALERRGWPVELVPLE